MLSSVLRPSTSVPITELFVLTLSPVASDPIVTVAVGALVVLVNVRATDASSTLPEPSSTLAVKLAEAAGNGEASLGVKLQVVPVTVA